ncbi:MAG: ergothioneine biosynthesis protein EgtB [Pseudomonadota bacterium]
MAPGWESRIAELCHHFGEVRQRSVELCAPLEIEDYGVQPMDDASPPKWHLAHTTWFFETFILREHGVPPFDPLYETLFNSYYNGVGTPYPRPRRGFLSRPTVAQILTYRQHVDQQMTRLLAEVNKGDHDDVSARQIVERLELGCHHEQQHQELLLTDIKYNLGHNPLYPVYGGEVSEPADPLPLKFTQCEGGIVSVGSQNGFAFDNELPRHETLLRPFALAHRLVTNAEYGEFIADGGYQRADLWLSEGWSTVHAQNWQAPLYWQQRDDEWWQYRLDGLHPLQGGLPVVHVSAHEAFAYANWAQARLPTEAEWESVATSLACAGNFVERGSFHPLGAADDGGLTQMFGDVWEWTSSSYGPYPGYRPLPGTLGEYNGKFMSSQLVLRGGSCATPANHIRSSYRNFFYPPDRWQFSGIRLARDLG